MITKIKLSAMFTAMLLGGATLLFHQTPKVQADDVMSPRTLYVQNCARCHGADGHAQTDLGKKLEAVDISGHQSSAKVIRTVTSGRGDMPSFKKRLTAAQIKQIAGYVHSSL